MRVKGEGPTPAEVMLVGEAPGKNEDLAGRPFIGKSGRELNWILELNGLNRTELYVTNVVKERPPYVNGKQQPPSKEDISRDEQELVEELIRVRPKWIGALGRVSARWLTGLDLDMEASWGLAYPLSVRVREMVLAEVERIRSSGRSEETPGTTVGGVSRSWVREEQVHSVFGDTRDACVVVSDRGPESHRPVEYISGQMLRVQAGEGAEHSTVEQICSWWTTSGGTCEETGESLRGDSERCSLSRQSESWVDEIRIVPTYHPAAGMHNAELNKYVWRGLATFCQLVKGELHPIYPVDRHPRPDYETGLPPIRRGEELQVACDTEGLPGRVWGGSLSSEAGRARVFKLSDAQQVDLYFGHRVSLPTQKPRRVIFHNSLHDVPILEEIGIHIDWNYVEDTFLMAYVLGLVPLGLKPLARRFCGMEMQSYLDVMAPADRKLAMQYVERALAAKQCPVCDGVGKVKEMRKDGKGYKKQLAKCTGESCIDGGLWSERGDQLKYNWDTGEWKITKGWSVGRYLNSLSEDMQAGKYEEIDEEDKVRNVRQRITNWPDDVIQIVAQEIGPLPEPTLDDIDPDAATYYSARDADATIRIYPILKEQVENMQLWQAYKLDLSVIPVAAEMQKNGMYISRPYFEDFQKELEYDNQIILAKLQHLVGKPINPASGDQVAALLFGERGLEFTSEDRRHFAFDGDITPEKFTKSGKRASTDDKTLEAIKLKHSDNEELVNLVDLILDYRIRDKILGTYVRKLPTIADKYDRVHTTIKPGRTATFRWASSDPNLQNIPTKSKNNVDLGKRVRMGFIAPPGYVLGSWDFDQVEMRVLAWYSQDANLLRVFREGLDIHSMTAALIWRIPLNQFMAELKGDNKELAKLRKEQRASAKNIGFGVVYGVTAKGLKAQMDLRGQRWSEDECQELIDMYLYSAYPGIGRWMSDAHAEARRNGYVRSLFGHIRYVPGVHSSISSVREEALRQAANFKIQCTAAELLKLSMRYLWEDYKGILDEVGSLLLMAVHDELLLQVPDNSEAREITNQVVTMAMTNPYPLEGVHISTEGKYEYNWGLLK